MQRETLRPPEGSVTDSEPCLLEIPHSLCPVPEAGVPRGQGSLRSCGPPVSWVAPCRQNACVSIRVLPSPGLPRPSCSLTLHPHIAPRYPGVSCHVVSTQLTLHCGCGRLRNVLSGPGLCQVSGIRQPTRAHPSWLSCHHLQLGRLLGPSQEAVTWSWGWPQRREPEQALGKDRETGAGRDRKGTETERDEGRRGGPCGPSPICL